MIDLSCKIFIFLLITSLSLEARSERIFRGAADASAAVALDRKRFIVADDEDNILRIYDWDRPDSFPIDTIDLSEALAAAGKHPETDIEGVTRLNNRIIWITSHGRSKKGDFRPNRCRLFSTTIAPDGKLTVEGFYSDLLSDLIQYDQTWKLGLQEAIGTEGGTINTNEISRLAPKKNGLNIEGLCLDAEGSQLLIAFRNPRPKINSRNMALIIPLANPEDVIMSKAKPQFKKPILLDLDGLGIRSIEYIPASQQYLIIAGSHAGGSDLLPFVLYTCDLDKSQPRKLAAFTDIIPEAILMFAHQTDLILLSDDGSRMIETPDGSIENKQQPRQARTFRAKNVKVSEFNSDVP